MSAQIQCNDPVLHCKFLHLILPLFSLAAESMDKNKRPLGMIRRNVDRRKPHQRICRNANLMPVQVKVYVHDVSVHEAGMDVNFIKQKSDR